MKYVLSLLLSLCLSVGALAAESDVSPEDEFDSFMIKELGGDAEAKYILGVVYYEGTDIPKNDKQALHWFQQAADQGYSRAQYNLGIMYQNGDGTPINDKQAFYWFLKAARQGNALAQNKLGLKYALGKGTNQNFVYSYVWHSLSKANGDQTANLGLDLAKKVMTSSQIQQAQALASACFTSNYLDCP